MKLRRRMVVMAAVGSLITGACAADHERTADEQEDLGRGIVVGTVGVQQEEGVSSGGTLMVAGEVMRIEGAAYVLLEFRGRERRVPLDENTRIDRPAHVGDKIEALLDGSGRALRIRNIDDEYWRYE